MLEYRFVWKKRVALQCSPVNFYSGRRAIFSCRSVGRKVNATFDRLPKPSEIENFIMLINIKNKIKFDRKQANTPLFSIRLKSVRD